MQSLHRSPFTVNFAEYLGRFSFIRSTLPATTAFHSTNGSPVELYIDSSRNFDFHTLLAVCDSETARMSNQHAVSLEAKLHCHNDTGAIINTKGIMLALIKTAPNNYAAEVVLSSSLGEPRVYRLIRINADVQAYITTETVHHHYIYCNALVGSRKSNVFHLESTRRIMHDPGTCVAIVGDINCLRAIQSLIADIGKKWHCALADLPSLVERNHSLTKQQIKVQMEEFVKSKARQMELIPVSSVVEQLLTDYYTGKSDSVGASAETVSEKVIERLKTATDILKQLEIEFPIDIPEIPERSTH